MAAIENTNAVVAVPAARAPQARSAEMEWGAEPNQPEWRTREAGYVILPRTLRGPGTQRVRGYIRMEHRGLIRGVPRRMANTASP